MMQKFVVGEKYLTMIEYVDMMSVAVIRHHKDALQTI